MNKLTISIKTVKGNEPPFRVDVEPKSVTPHTEVFFDNQHEKSVRVWVTETKDETTSIDWASFIVNANKYHDNDGILDVKGKTKVPNEVDTRMTIKDRPDGFKFFVHVSMPKGEPGGDLTKSAEIVVVPPSKLSN